MMDALGAFSYMCDNLPAWIDQISELAAYTAAKHAEYTEAYKKYAPVRPRRRKNSSVCSIRTHDIFPSSQNRGTSVETTQGTPSTAPGASISQIRWIGNPRKRNADGTPSIDSAEGIADFVSIRHNVVIHYDGHTQKSLEDMVRNIGTARNNMRRGKMSQISLGGLRSRMGNQDARKNRPAPALLDQIDGSGGDILSNIRSMRTRGSPPAEASSSRLPPKETVFDVVDRQLELAHSHCETAAYHFLRYGDCSTELKNVVETFRSLLELATNEAQSLKGEQPEESLKEDVKKGSVMFSPMKTAAESQCGKPLASCTDEIEVDDASAASVESIDIKAFRASRLRA
ncbi:hypothetical protein Asppvi_004907 [Aspergillus pseudoviridinutans]|uniref:Uncharacterized protein n=1 Tax=Aspergillus pseudoviridinutans TaxID=1517512 RepID=A0A9P3ESD0_9EURO|nr:uncharacterized protein Asppvi_004907 [Aspergillus pseudoviridinutans]GIJ86034.1 hypothetical protein Asppvi_004907 [Aspergillus pseudoviridinutans]